MAGEQTCPHCGEINAEGRALCGACGGALRAPRSSTTGAPLEPGRYIGRMISQRYRVVERIARGGMGEVYVAEHVEMRQLVAVKFLHKRYAHDESFAARFFNEARYAAQVTHPNAVALYDFGRLDDGTLFIVMEYVRGEALSRVVRSQGMIPVPMAIRIASQVAEVLASAHEKKIIHRDVKPDNIMLVQGAGGRVAVKVLDFGIAKILDDEDGHHTEPGVMFGTPEYMSPEQAMGAIYDHRVDVYALGLVLYYMLVGSPPFSGSNKMAVLQAQVREKAPALERSARQPVPKRLVHLIESMLSKSPDDRPSDMIEVFNELDAILAADDPDADIISSQVLESISGRHANVISGRQAAASQEDDSLDVDDLEADIVSSQPIEIVSARLATLDLSRAHEHDEHGAVIFPRAQVPAPVTRTEPVKSVPMPVFMGSKGTKPKEEKYEPLQRDNAAATLAPLRYEGDEGYTLTGKNRVLTPLAKDSSVKKPARRFRRESALLFGLIVAVCSLLILFAVLWTFKVLGESGSVADQTLAQADDTAPTDGDIAAAEGPSLDPEDGDPSRGATATVGGLEGGAANSARHGAALQRAEKALADGDLRAAKEALAAIPVTDAPAGFADVRREVLRVEELNRSIEQALSRGQCDAAKTAQSTLSREANASLAAKHQDGIAACEARVAAAAAAPAAKPPVAAPARPTPAAPAARPATPPPAPKPASVVQPPSATQPVDPRPDPPKPPAPAPSALPDDVRTPAPPAATPTPPPAAPPAAPASPPAAPVPPAATPAPPPAAGSVLPPMEL